MIGGSRHNLHEALGTCPRRRLGVEGGLLIALCRQQPPVPTDVPSVLHEPLIVFGDDAALTVEHRREDTTLHAARRQPEGLRLLRLGQQRVRVPALHLLVEQGFLGVHGQGTRCGPRSNVDVARLQFLCHLSRVAAEVDAEADAKV